MRYGLYAIKSLGRPVIDSIIGERKKGGSYRTLQDFIERTVQRDINKRAIENLSKAGACDGLDGNRHQMSIVYTSMVDDVVRRKKTGLEGQMSLSLTDTKTVTYLILFGILFGLTGRLFAVL